MTTDTDTVEIDGVEYDLTPKTVEADGVTFVFRWKRGGLFGSLRTFVEICRDQLTRVREIPFTDSSAEGHFTIVVTEADGTVLFESYSLEAAKDRLARIERLDRTEAARQEAHEHIRQLWAELRALQIRGLPVLHLGSLIRNAESTASAMGGSWRDASFSDAQACIARARHEIERLEGDPTGVLVDELMSGRLMPAVHEHNKAVIARLDALEIRSGGFIESIDAEKLRRFYRRALNGATRVEQPVPYDLRLRLEDYAPADVVADPDLELAPETVELVGRKGSSSYSIAYAYEQIDGERVPVASMTVALSVYERNCAEHGRQSNFPQIEGVRLMITVTVDGKEIARGQDGEWLKGRVKKFQGGKKRSVLAEEVSYVSGFIGGDTRPTDPPPWFHGKTRRR